MNARKILLLLLILGFGAAVETAWVVRGHADLGPVGCRVLAGKFYGPSFTFESEERHAVVPGTAVELQNAFGSVRVLRGGPGEAEVKLRKVVFRNTEEEARGFADRIRLTADLAGTALRLGTNREELERGEGARVGFETHLVVTVPPDTAVTVRNEHGAVDVVDVAAADLWASFDSLRAERVAGPLVARIHHGDVYVSGVRGAVSLTARHGQVEVLDVEGQATLETQHGSVTARRTGALTVQASHGEVEVEDVRGDLEVRAAHARVVAAGVSGRAVVESSFNDARLERVEGEARVRVEHGGVSVADVKGAVFAQASFNDVVLTRIAGPAEVSVSHGGLEAEGLEKGARVNASGDEVVINGFRGPLEVKAERASVRLVPAGAVQWPITVSTTHGGIELQVPAGSRFDLEAAAERGELSLNVPGLTITRSDASRLAGQMGGGGSLVKLTADHGDVRLQPGVEVAAQDR